MKFKLFETNFSIHNQCMIYAPINVKPQGGGGGGYLREIDSESLSLGRDFDM